MFYVYRNEDDDFKPVSTLQGIMRVVIFTLTVIAVVVLIFNIYHGEVFGQKGDSYSYEDSLKVSYAPLFTPVLFSISMEGEFNVIANGRIITPIGSFSAEWERKKIFYLEVTLGQQTRFFKLGKHEFNLDLPNSLKENSRVKYDGNGNVRIIVPEPGNIRFPT